MTKLFNVRLLLSNIRKHLVRLRSERRNGQANGFGEIPDSEMAVVCDDCYKAILAIFKGTDL